MEDLISKYSNSTPRYTSYPTAVEFNNSVDSKLWCSELAKQFNSTQPPQPISLYVHIPFCHSLCYFCACNKKIAQNDAGVRPYLKALSKEISSCRGQIKSSTSLVQLHWGGGTPNFLSADASSELYETCAENFSTSPDADISIEIDPRTITNSHLDAYQALGFNRVSAGVQDFSPVVQKTINRIQPYEQTKEVCDEIRQRGFSGLNIDLIYGLPEQNITSFSKTIEQLLTIRPDRIALYGYAHVTWKKKVQRSLERHKLPSPQQRINLFMTALDSLLEAGYCYIGMDHFALPEDPLTKALRNGTLNRNFMGYSTHRGASVLGVGVSAVSSLPEILAQNNVDIELYQEQVERCGFATHRGVVRTEEDRLRAAIIEHILCSGRLDIESLEAEWEINFYRKFAHIIPILKQLQDDELIRLESDYIEVSETGRFFLRNIASTFDAYLPQHRHSASKVFSQSI